MSWEYSLTKVKHLILFIDHKKLLHKLNNCGIRGTAHAFLKLYRTNRQQYTEILDYKSERLVIEYGLPQGYVLGPILFLLYISDIVNCSKLGNFVPFSDDIYIFVSETTAKQEYC